MTSEFGLDSMEPGQEAADVADRSVSPGIDLTQPVPAEAGCLKDVREMLDLAQKVRKSETPGAADSQFDEENSATHQLQSAISEFLNRISPNQTASADSSTPTEQTHQARPRDDDRTAVVSPEDPLEPRAAPETADILERLRDLAKLSADDAIGQHAARQLIGKTKRSLWISSLALLGTCGLLHVPWKERPELNVAIWVAFSVAVVSTASYFLLVRKLHMEMADEPRG